MIISGGVNIYPAEIEAAIHAIPNVSDCAVFGVPDEEFGEAVVAYIQPFEEGTLTVDAVRLALEEAIARFKIPRLMKIVATLPREDSGKIFKRKLRDEYLGLVV